MDSGKPLPSLIEKYIRRKTERVTLPKGNDDFTLASLQVLEGSSFGTASEGQYHYKKYW
jgi:hypothetical protein